MVRRWIMQQNLIAVLDQRPWGSHRDHLQENCSEPHLAGVSLPAVDVGGVDFMAVGAILWKTQDLFKLHSLRMI